MHKKNKSPRLLAAAAASSRANRKRVKHQKDWNQDGPCRVVVLHLSLLIHCCIDCVFIWRGSGEELMSEAAILSPPLLFLIWQRAAEAKGRRAG